MRWTRPFEEKIGHQDHEIRGIELGIVIDITGRETGRDRSSQKEIHEKEDAVGEIGAAVTIAVPTRKRLSDTNDDVVALEKDGKNRLVVGDRCSAS